MLGQIIHFKETFLVSKGENINDIESFLNELSTYSSNEAINFSLVSYWNNYLHACLLSAFSQTVGYSLENWNSYFSNSSKICEFLQISPPNEAQVLELFVIHTINYVFDFSQSNLSIKALRSNDSKNPIYLTDDSNDPDFLSPNDNQRLIDNLKVVMKMRGYPEKRIWGDNDIIVTFSFNNTIQQFCIISCKTSLRERVYQSIFWAMHSRLEGVGKHVFVTTDKGASGKSEIGNRSPENIAKKSRDVLESTMDRVYVFRNADEVNRSQVIKDFVHLEKDLLRWAIDLAGIQ